VETPANANVTAAFGTGVQPGVSGDLFGAGITFNDGAPMPTEVFTSKKDVDDMATAGTHIVTMIWYYKAP
jgi:hypothetical protein